MFVGDEVMLDIPFPAARTGLARLALAGLLPPAQEAFWHGRAVLEQPVWPARLALTQVQARALARTRESAGLAIRWQAAEPGGGSFNVLDADLGLVPAGEPATLLTLAGSYRIPPGAPDDGPGRAVLRQVAAATIRHFLSRVAADLTGQPGAAGPGRAAQAPPGSGSVPGGPPGR